MRADACPGVRVWTQPLFPTINLKCWGCCFTNYISWYCSKRIFRLKQNFTETFFQVTISLFRYFGRKRLQENDEIWVPGTKYLVEAGYSYWTLGYVLSLSGTRKLLDADPLSRLLPVDEYLPILFNKHPQVSCKFLCGCVCCRCTIKKIATNVFLFLSSNRFLLSVVIFSTFWRHFY